MRFQRTFCAAPSNVLPVKLPSAMETHLWYIVADEVKSMSLLSKYMQLLSPSEKQSVLLLPSNHLQKQAILARTLVRTTIARYQINGHVDPRSLNFRRNIHGKPELEWQSSDGQFPPPLHFNISHTSSLIACGVTLTSQIGIDLEEKERKIKNCVLAFARRYFSSHEVECLSAISEPEVQRQEFIKLWTLKEAYVKALGKGFSAAPFKTFTIRMKAASEESRVVLSEGINYQASEIVVESSDDPGSNWQFALVQLAGSHYAAICMEKDEAGHNRVKVPIKLTTWKTVPYVEDKCVSGTDLVVALGGLVELL